MTNFTPNGNLTDKQIKALEKKLRLKLPEDYKEFLKSTNGGVVDLGPTEASNSVVISEINERVHAEIFYGYENPEELANLLYWNEEYGSELEDFLIIGSSLEQGFFLLCCDRDPRYRNAVCYWDDSYVFEQSTDDDNMYLLAKTFTDFMNALEENQG